MSEPSDWLTTSLAVGAVSCAICIIMHIRFLYVVRYSSELYRMPAYRIMIQASIFDTMNLITQLFAVIYSLTPYKMNATVNKINGAIFQGSWAVEYPTILILAVNRVLSITFPTKIDNIFKKRNTNILILFCWLFGLCNLIICLVPQASTLWDPTTPSFYFTSGTVLESILFYIDFYGGETVVTGSLICYIYILFAIVVKVYQKKMNNVRLEIPLLIHFVIIFLMTGVVLFIWHHPDMIESEIFWNLFNELVILRFSVIPFSAFCTIGVVRNRFFRRDWSSTMHSKAGITITRVKTIVKVGRNQ